MVNSVQFLVFQVLEQLLRHVLGCFKVVAKGLFHYDAQPSGTDRISLVIGLGQRGLGCRIECFIR